MLAVLSTAELLNCILQHLDPKTLLLARAVNHHWNKAIQSDPWCQGKLFYTHHPTRCETNMPYLWIPRENRLERWTQFGQPDAEKQELDDASQFLLTPITLNPLLTEEILQLEFDWPSQLVASDYPPNMPDQGQRLEIQGQGQRLENIAISTLLRSPHGSWRSMFISSPPTTKIFGRSIFYWPYDPPIHWHRHRQRYHRFTLEDAAGVRMSSLVDEVLTMAERLGVGVEKLAEARLNCWTLTCHNRIHLGDESSGVHGDTNVVAAEEADSKWLPLL